MVVTEQCRRQRFRGLLRVAPWRCHQQLRTLKYRRRCQTMRNSCPQQSQLHKTYETDPCIWCRTIAIVQNMHIRMVKRGYVQQMPAPALTQWPSLPKMCVCAQPADFIAVVQRMASKTPPKCHDLSCPNPQPLCFFSLALFRYRSAMPVPFLVQRYNASTVCRRYCVSFCGT
jgi:hypothetical protein